MVHILDGKRIADRLKSYITQEIKALSIHNLVPSLGIIRVGDDPASKIYVTSKLATAKAVGIKAQEYYFPSTCDQQTVSQQIQSLDRDPLIHGMIIQLPLPNHINRFEVLNQVSPSKDIDGLTVHNAGLLAVGEENLVPCTPLGCIILLRAYGIDPQGKNALIIGRSNLVSKPVAHMLLQDDATITIAHSKTQNLPEICRRADIVIAAAGQPGLVQKEWLKPKAVILDVGQRRVGDAIKGDVDFDQLVDTDVWITPVPGGVGPMTVACLLLNTTIAAMKQNNIRPTHLPLQPLKERWCPL